MNLKLKTPDSNVWGFSRVRYLIEIIKITLCSYLIGLKDHVFSTTEKAICEFTWASISRRVYVRSLLWIPLFIHIETRSTCYHKNFALRLPLKGRPKGTWKWSIGFLSRNRSRLITRMVTDWIGLHSALLPFLISPSVSVLRKTRAKLDPT